MIDRIFQTVKTLLNTDGRGNFDPSDFNLILFNSIQELYDGYITDINQQVNRENRGLINGGLENVPERIREKLSHYLESAVVSKSGGSYALPTDYKYFDTVTTGDGVEFEKCKSHQEFNIVKDTVATREFPVYMKSGNHIRTAPDWVDPLVIYYLRQPLFPRWTYVKVGGTEMFNPSAADFRDADIHPADEAELTSLVCLKFGINLKEQDMVANMQNRESLDKTNEKVS